MAITSIKRDIVGDPNIIRIEDSGLLSSVVVADYFTSQNDNINDFNHGDFEIFDGETCLISCSDGEAFFNYDATTDTFIEDTDTGGLPNTLANGRIFVGNASGVATGVAVTGNVNITNAGVTSIDLADGQIFVGSAGNVAVAVGLSGPVAITNGGVSTLGLANGQMYVGNASNVAAPVAITGDVTISNTGVTTIGAGTVDLAMLNSDVAPDFIAAFGNSFFTTGGGGVTEAVTVNGVLSTYLPFVQLLDPGTNVVSIVSCAVTANTLAVTFSADPGNNAKVAYLIYRPTS